MPNTLHHYLQTWQLSDPQPLAETPTSQIFTVTHGETRVVLKLLTPVGVADEKNGAVALRHWDGRGAVRLLREDGQAHLLEYIDGQDLTALVKKGEDEKATAIIGDVLNQLHAASANHYPDGLTPLKVWFHALFKKAEMDRKAGLNSIFVRASPVAEELLARPQAVRVLHGDIHHENIRYHARRGWVAFDPKGLIGERTYDAANTFCNPVNMPELVENEARVLKTAGILADKMGISSQRVLAFVYAYTCLSASWSLEEGHRAVAEHTLRIAELVEPHLRW